MRRRRSQAYKEREREFENTPEFTIDTPNDPINEQVVLAAACIDKETRKTISKYPVEIFYADKHRAIFSGIKELTRRKLKFDPATISRLSPEADIGYLEVLMESRPDVPPNVDFHLDTLKWDWQRARVTQGPISALLDAIQNPKEDPDRVRLLARQVGEAFDKDEGKFIRNSKEVVREAVANLKRRIQGEAHYPFGIEGLDYYEDGRRRLRPGAAPGTISMITALSGSGKSTFTGHMVLGLARQRRRVLFGSWEENAPVTIELLTTLSLEWSRSRVLDGKSNRLVDGSSQDFEPMNREELVLFEERAHAISKYVKFFNNPFQRNKLPNGRRPTNDDNIDIINEHVADSGCSAFVADLLQRAFPDTSPEDERHSLFRLLAMVEEQRIFLGAVHQQRAKDIETRPDKRPTREGIIGSGAWLDVCWHVLAPHLPAKWKRVPDNTMEIYILKQRNGPWPIAVEFDWDPEKGQIWGGRSLDVNSVETSEDNLEGFLKPRTTGKKRR